METNQFFSLKRFYLLLRNDVLINYKMYLLTTLTAFMALFFLIYMQIPGSHFEYPFSYNYIKASFYICLFGLGLFIGTSFPDMENKIKARSYIMLPSSTFEKFLAQFLIRIVLGSILFMLIFWIDTRLTRLATIAIYNDYSTYYGIFHFSDLYNDANTFLSNISFTFFFFSIGSFLFSVRLFFMKNPLLKTVISAIAVLYLILCFMMFFSHIFFNSTVSFDINNYGRSILNSKITSFEIWLYSAMLVSWIFLLPIGYFKLKEKQV